MSNTFGNLFRFTTWGESHGKAIGVVIDGCPAGLEIDESEINVMLAERAPGKSPFTSPRTEPDCAEILSGIHEGKSTGAPISILIHNRDVDSSKYESMKHIFRPGHANFTYLKKFGTDDWRGGGRASARETACRVAAGAIARKFLQQKGIFICAFIREIAGIAAGICQEDLPQLRKKTYASPIFCPDENAAEKMMQAIQAAKEDGDSVGGIVEMAATGVPGGLGDPVYDKLEAKLAFAMMSIPASKGFEMGDGFAAARLRGSEQNDSFVLKEGEVRTETNHAGGTLGGISTGMPIVARVAFKPTSSIMKAQSSLDTNGQNALFQLPQGSRHDPCVSIRAVPVVEAMLALVLIDCVLKAEALNTKSTTLCSTPSL